MQDLVYSELMGSVTFEMLEDKLVLLIQDNGVFLVTTKENSEKYNEEFYPVIAEGVEAFGIRLVGGRMISNNP